MTYRAYAGVGSRKTPLDIQEMMFNFARLACDLGWTLRSGGAEGADEAFERGVHKSYRKEIYLPWGAFNNNQSRWVKPSDEAMERAETLLGPDHWENLSLGGRKLHARNVHQVLGKDCNDPVKFLICWTPRGNITGGTATAIRLAMLHDIPVFNLGFKFDIEKLETIVRG
jgi:hypothetical protein